MSKKLLDKKQAVMRSFTFADLRAKPLTRDDGQDDGIRILEGHASVFEQDTDIGGYFTERISKGAFDDCDFTDEDHPIRTIHKIKKVYEVSAVNWPAYDGTDISGRDKDAVDTAKKAVETARAQALDNAAEKEKIKIRNRILGGI